MIKPLARDRVLLQQGGRARQILPRQLEGRFGFPSCGADNVLFEFALSDRQVFVLRLGLLQRRFGVRHLRFGGSGVDAEEDGAPGDERTAVNWTRNQTARGRRRDQRGLTLVNAG